MSHLINESVDFALSIIEKDGALVPFCRLLDHTGAPFILSCSASASDFEGAYTSARADLSRRIAKGEVTAFAFCADVSTMFADRTDQQRCLRIEFQDGSDISGMYYFPLSVESGHATVGEYVVANLARKEL